MPDPTASSPPPEQAQAPRPAVAVDATDPGDAASEGQGVGLDALGAGQAGVILKMDEEDHAMLIRLKTMGMHPGRAVRVLRPGSRLVVTCGGTRIGLSAVVARHILVSPTAS